MNTMLLTQQQPVDNSTDAAIQLSITTIIDDVISSLPECSQLTSDERRGIIARYTAVLEGNFIYWMTATLLSVHAEEAKPILLENLHEEVRDAHPAMLRRFAVAAHAFPNASDALAIDSGLNKVRVFLGRLSGVQSLATMAFFEGFIQRFMGYLANLAAAQGSTEMEYTDVHGICDIAHTEGLFQALSVEMASHPLDSSKDVLEGVYLLRDLVDDVVFNRAA